jgi:hypothetical protein
VDRHHIDANLWIWTRSSKMEFGIRVGIVTMRIHNTSLNSKTLIEVETVIYGPALCVDDVWPGPGAGERARAPRLPLHPVCRH